MAHIIGIDLGTTNTCASVVENGQPRIIPSSKGYQIIPSVVGFTPNDELLVGIDAVRQSLINPENTIYGAKRLLGRKYSSRIVQDVKRAFHYQIIEGHNGEVEVLGNGRPFTIPEVMSLILREIRKAAAEYLHDEDLQAVITCPAYFNDRQRFAVKEAGRLAGLEVVRIINEPTAAALAYGYRKGIERKIVVYDLGGGTFDVSVMDLGQDVYQVLSTLGDTFLGGVDFDNRIVEQMTDRFEKETGLNLMGDRIALQRLKAAAEEAKKELSLRTESVINLPYIATGSDGPLNLSYKIKREELEQWVQGLVDKTIDVCQTAIEAAKLMPNEIDDVVLVGGQTRMPLLWEKVKYYFGRSPSKGVHPDEVTAMGAAIMADILSRGETGVLLLDVVPLSIGLALPGGRFKKIISRNSTTPIKKTEVFTTSKDNQKSVSITVMQGDNAKVEENEVLSSFAFTGLPPHRKGQLRIEVTFAVDADGILTVSARDQSTGRKVTTTINPQKTPTPVT
jgi:molecular chaperone DnaK